MRVPGGAGSVMMKIVTVMVTYETAVISRALKPHLTIRHGLLGTVKTDRLIGDRKRTPTTISHFEGMARTAPATGIAKRDNSVFVEAPNVSFWLQGDIRRPKIDFRFAPESRHSRGRH